MEKRPKFCSRSLQDLSFKRDAVTFYKILCDFDEINVVLKKKLEITTKKSTKNYSKIYIFLIIFFRVTFFGLKLAYISFMKFYIYLDKVRFSKYFNLWFISKINPFYIQNKVQ